MEEENSEKENHKEEEHHDSEKVEHKEEHHHEHKAHKNKPRIKLKKQDAWKYATILTVVLLIISIFTGGFGQTSSASSTSPITQEQAAEKAVSYINTNLLQDGTVAEVTATTEKNGVYEVNISIKDQDYSSYISKDGVILFTSGIDITEKVAAPAQAQQQPAQDIKKTDKPKVELFVMSHCPFGTQAEKGMIPVVELLGDKIDFSLKFVNYAMHGEKEVNEQLRQYCIDIEQNDKFLPYLKCFLKDGKSEPCLDELKVDKEKLADCEEAKDTDSLLKIWEEMKAKSFLNYNVDIKKQDEHLDDFKVLSLTEQKQHLCELLDKNQLYVNLSSLNDADFACTAEEKKVTQNFYQIKK